MVRVPARYMPAPGDSEVGDDEETVGGIYVGDDNIPDHLYPGEVGREPDIQNCGFGQAGAKREHLDEVMSGT